MPSSWKTVMDLQILIVDFDEAAEVLPVRSLRRGRLGQPDTGGQTQQFLKMMLN